MKKKISVLLVSLIFSLVITACAGEHKVALKDTSKVLVSVDGKNITQQQKDMVRISSVFSEKEAIEKAIDEILLFEKD